MRYCSHLRAVLDALFAARPDLSPRRLSVEAGLSPGWVSEFLKSERATLEKADCALRAALRLAPEGPEGAAVRALARNLRCRPDDAGPERGAA